MTPDRWQRIKSVFQGALDLDEAARADFIAAQCADDAELREQVLRLFEAERESSALDKGAIGHVPDFSLARARQRWIGRVLGPYRIVEALGEGGMGEVYRAVRDDGEFSKDVAIKLVRGGQDSEHVLARFRAERQILAGLAHPNIAYLVDGGVTEDDVPYLVMELVNGVPIDIYCARNRLSVPACLDLVRTVCAAVQYAHQHLVVHRDLKPSNILVTDDGTVKLLDFGIAKLIEGEDVSAGTAPTVTAQRILTPEYASPEQVRGLPITTASDIYSLGVVLFHLLTGESPYGKSSSPHELIRAICETASSKPSTVVRKTTSQLEGRRRASQLSGDIDNIVLMALRKEPERRYASAAELAEDLRRYLSGLPVRAHEDTLAYRMRKLVIRHKFAAAAGVLTAGALIASSVVTYRQAVVARAERARAERHFGDVRKLVNSFLFEVHDAVQDLPGSIAARRLLVQNALSYLDILSRDPSSDPALKREMGIAYRKVGDLQGRAGRPNTGDGKGARESYSRAIALFDSLLSADPGDEGTRIELAIALKERASVNLLRSNDEEAGSDAARAVELSGAAAARSADPQILGILADAQVALAWTKDRKGDTAGALALTEQSLELHGRIAATGRPDREAAHRHGGAYHTLAQFMTREQSGKRYADALAAVQKALAIHKPLLDENPGDPLALTGVAHDHRLIGMLNMSLDNPAAAVSAFRVATDHYARAAALDPQGMAVRPSRVDLMLRYAEALHAQGDTTTAMVKARETLDLSVEWQARSDISFLKIIAARSQGMLGKLHMARARDMRLPTARRLDHWRQAESWYGAANLAYDRLREQKLLPIQDQREFDDVAAGLKAAREGLASAGG